MRLFNLRAAPFFVAILLLPILVSRPAAAQSFIRDAEIEAMLREFTDPVLEAGGLQPEDVSLYVINDSSINAFVTGGQNIFMHTGTIIEAETPNQLIAVLAHETGHITGGHLVRQSEGMRAAMGPAIFAMAAGLLAALAGEGGAAAGLLSSSQQFAMLSFFQHTQAAESSADVAGTNYLEATGQSGRGMIEFFERFRYQEVLSEHRDPYFRTHPLSSARIEALRVRVAEMEHVDAVDTPEHIDMLDRARAKIIGFTEPLRVTLVRYPESDDSTPALYARSIAHFRAGSVAQSIVAVEQLIEREPENPYFHELHGQVLYENGRVEESIPPYARAVELEPDSALLRIGLAQSMIRADDDELLDEADEHITFALRDEPGNTWAWALRAEIFERRGDTPRAQLASAERFYHVDPARSRAFASQARGELQRGSPEWHRANDIVLTIDGAMAEEGARNRGG